LVAVFTGCLSSTVHANNSKGFNQADKSIAGSGSLKVSCGEASYTITDEQPPDKPDFERTEWPANKNPAFYKPLLTKNPPQQKAICPGYVPGGPARLKPDDIKKAVEATCKEWADTNKGNPQQWTLKWAKTFEAGKDLDFHTYDPEEGSLGPDLALWKDNKIYLVKEWNSQYCEEGKNGANDVDYGKITAKECQKNFMAGIDGCKFLPRDIDTPLT
jgi:hypothetical protein